MAGQIGSEFWRRNGPKPLRMSRGTNGGRILASPMNRQRPSKDEGVIIMTKILSDLPSHDREALARFYVDGQPHEEIEAALSLDADHFRALKASVRAAFFNKTGLGC